MDGGLLESINVSDDGRVSGKKEPKLHQQDGNDDTEKTPPHSMTQTTLDQKNNGYYLWLYFIAFLPKSKARVLPCWWACL